MATLRDLAPQYLYTKRLTLDLYNHSEEHHKCVLHIINTKTAHERMGDMGIRTPTELDAFHGQLRLRHPKFKDGIADDDCLYMIRVGPHDPHGELAGVVSIFQRVSGTEVVPADIGWVLAEEHMGKGYATEAASRVLKWAREDLGITDIVVFPSEGNRQSNRVAEKLGFIEGGKVADLDNPGKWMNVLILPGRERIEIPGGLSVK